MNKQLEKKIDKFTANKEALMKKYPSLDPQTAGYMNFLFLNQGKVLDREKLDDAENGLNIESCSFDMPREVLKYVLLAEAALSGDPAAFYDSMGKINTKIRAGKLFENGNEVLAAMILSGFAGEIDVDEAVKRVAKVLSEMNRDHPILTDRNDTVSAAALALAYPDLTPRQIADKVKECYKILKKELDKRAANGNELDRYLDESVLLRKDAPEFVNNEIQTAAAVVAGTEGDYAEKCGKVLEILGSLKDKGMSPKFGDGLSLLGALAALPKSAEEILTDLTGISAYLEGKPGYQDADDRLLDAAAFMLLQAPEDEASAFNSLISPAAMILLAAAR